MGLTWLGGSQGGHFFSDRQVASQYEWDYLMDAQHGHHGAATLGPRAPPPPSQATVLDSVSNISTGFGI